MVYNYCMNKIKPKRAKLNENQAKAVETIHGSLLVLAGPGTGKTELLGRRVANILKVDDVSASNILCLTFTDTGSINMQSRLREIIGGEAGKVAVHTFHAFCSDIRNRYPEYFYEGSETVMIDDYINHSMIESILEKLPINNPLANKIDGGFLYAPSIIGAISKLKSNGITPDDFSKILNSNAQIMKLLSDDLDTILSPRVSKHMLPELQNFAIKSSKLPKQNLPGGVTSYANIVAASIARTVKTTLETEKTASITEWKNTWAKKDKSGNRLIFKDENYTEKMSALNEIYEIYLEEMKRNNYTDFNDLIIDVTNAIKKYPDLKAELQEQYQYIMVDEFQDTNLAQLNIVFLLTDYDENPNVMVVGDDDQGIFAFQGADVNNINKFRKNYPKHKVISLTENYRSHGEILRLSCQVIDQSETSLSSIDSNINKKLIAKYNPENHCVKHIEHQNSADELLWIAKDIAQRIKEGEIPSNIAVIAKKHSSLLDLVPYLDNLGIKISYERKDNALDNQLVSLLQEIMITIQAINQGDENSLDETLAYIITHPSFNFSARKICEIGIESKKLRKPWYKIMQKHSDFQEFIDWLIRLAIFSRHANLEEVIEYAIGKQKFYDQTFKSPIFDYYFGEISDENVDEYISCLESLKSILDTVKKYAGDEKARVLDFIDCVKGHETAKIKIPILRSSGHDLTNAVNLMTAHGSKGLEFNTVYIIQSLDSSWGKKARKKPEKLLFPKNLPLTTTDGASDERLRLYFVAMTRAKNNLIITNSTNSDDNKKQFLSADFLNETDIQKTTATPPKQLEDKLVKAEYNWYHDISPKIKETVAEVLSPMIEKYRLSATDLQKFLDVSREGPRQFLTSSLLRFPQGSSVHLAFGNAIHQTLQKAHNFITNSNIRRQPEDIISDFETYLKSYPLDKKELEDYTQKGIEALRVFLDQEYASFNNKQKSEISFSTQDCRVGSALLSGKLDLLEVNQKNAIVTDYKTGKPSADWKGVTPSEKIKLHQYKQQLMFYTLLIKKSRDFSELQVQQAKIQFVIPDDAKKIHTLAATWTEEEMDDFEILIQAVWQKINNLEFNDISDYSKNLDGIKRFEQKLVEDFKNNQRI